MKIVKKIGVGLLVVFLIAQFFRPDKNEGDLLSLQSFIDETKPPEHVRVIFNESCFDCHSNVTRYPWYNAITPVNYWIADHVDHGKEELNFSIWNDYSTKRKDHKFEEIIELVESREMPLEEYTYTHFDAKLTDEQIKSIVDWANQVRFSYGLIEEKPE